MLEKLSTIEPEGWDKEQIKLEIPKLQEEVVELVRKLIAEKKKGLLVVIQGIDGSGKDGLLKGLFHGMSPGWINVKYFVKPSDEEFAHDFLWRVHPHVPKKGEIGVFIRSHYEDILVPSVYGYIDKKTIDKRYDQINAFENYLQENNVEVVKFYLHISKEKQEETLMERITDPKKHWKHSDGDWETREKWDELMKTYEKILKKCSTIPWYVIPSDKNWVKEYTSLVIMKDILNKLNPKYPKLISERFSEK